MSVLSSKCNHLLAIKYQVVFKKNEYILYLEKLSYNFWFLNVLKARTSFLFLCSASILKLFRHSCNRCLNSNQILLIDPLPFHSFLNLNTELLLHAWLHFPKFTCSWVIKYYIEFWAYVRRRILANYGANGFGISSLGFQIEQNYAQMNE